MWGLIAVVLVAWLVLAVVGLVIKGLFLLFLIGLGLLFATAAYAWFRRKTDSPT
ncbi:MAG: hypothetical protein H0V23_02260 [Nocardioidaceae bacterium]|nr:hypothetical protein [Nocardioidaceae bacterium]